MSSSPIFCLCAVYSKPPPPPFWLTPPRWMQVGYWPEQKQSRWTETTKFPADFLSHAKPHQCRDFKMRFLSWILHERWINISCYSSLMTPRSWWYLMIKRFQMLCFVQLKDFVVQYDVRQRDKPTTVCSRILIFFGHSGKPDASKLFFLLCSQTTSIFVYFPTLSNWTGY